ncbi:ABC transporter ATP-binding protein [Bradyrhizobium sp. SZCCHNR2017]|uniref:ABC transporter ATP-binding protein n=1 Tax=unclassified Bradyrhizobium TaxID=2631580 RepID=UPI0039678AB5
MSQKQGRTEPFIVFQNVRKAYDASSLVVRDLSFEIRRGEFMSLLGPSGSGKTTTLMMLAGFEELSGGSIVLSGRSLVGIPPHRRNIGVVFQNYALFPHMTVEENVAFPLVQRRMRREEIKGLVRKALDVVGLSSLAGRYPAQLSGGQQQRIALSRAFIFDPSLVLMDEPLGALDRRIREQMQMEIKRIHQRTSATILYVTHDQAEALAMSDRIAVFNEGRIEQIGSPADIYENPETEFVAGFVGENNLLSGRVAAREATRVLVDVPGLGTISVRSSGSAQVGETLSLAIRPEKLKICAERSDGFEVHPGHLVERTYRGDHFLCAVELDQTRQLRVKLLVDTAMASDLALGDRVLVGWRPEDWRAFAGA